jgi:epoxyqueuosine reductase QueG
MNRNELEDLARNWGADFFGVADLTPFRGAPTIPEDLLDPFERAVSLGVALSRSIFDNLVDGPDPPYSHHYLTANALLDRIAFRLTGAIQKAGGAALPIPASQMRDDVLWRGAISHKAVARMAGLGWQGKSLLLVNPDVGPRLRLVTILTSLPLSPDQPLANRCGKCMECSKACPAGAIKGTPWGEGYSRREDAWDPKKCTDHLINEFSKRPDVVPLICGLCIKACPFGRSGRRKAEETTGEEGFPG